MNRTPLTRLLRGLGFGIAAGLLTLVLGLTGLARTAEMKLYDWRTRRAVSTRDAAPSADIVLVNIDDDSLRRMEPIVGRWPWPRLVHATLIDYLAAGGAKAVLYRRAVCRSQSLEVHGGRDGVDGRGVGPGPGGGH